MLEINKIKFRPHLDMFFSFVGFLVDAKIKADPKMADFGTRLTKGIFNILPPITKYLCSI